MDQFKAELEKVLVAWDSLPKGAYTPATINRWLNDTMGPAIQRARSALTSSSPEYLTDKAPHR